MKRNIDAILVIYHHPPTANAPTILEHVDAFRKYSSFQVIKVNVAYGFPQGLESIQFAAIILHYSLFGVTPFLLNNKFLQYIDSSCSVKIMFFQDEMHYCRERFDIINRLNVEVIYSLLDERYFDQVYLRNTTVKTIKHTLTGYVCDELITKAKKYYIPFADRTIDVGYRARNLSYHYGRGAREKGEIADTFIKAVGHTHLKLDISTQEHDRIYGDNWYQFTANCKFSLGVMAGTSIFDLTGTIKEEVDCYLQKNPQASFGEVERAILAPYEENINYRTISPRLFECAAFRTCMILYRDDYQGILIAGKHYIALNKDFSNINSVLQQMQDSALVDSIVHNAYTDLIASGRWHYKHFIQEFDDMLVDLGCKQACSLEIIDWVNNAVSKDAWLRHSIAWLKGPVPGREFIKAVAYKLGYKPGGINHVWYRRPT